MSVVIFLLSQFLVTKLCSFGSFPNVLYSFNTKTCVSGIHIHNADLVLILPLSMADIANLILLAIHRMVTMAQIEDSFYRSGGSSVFVASVGQ